MIITHASHKVRKNVRGPGCTRRRWGGGDWGLQAIKFGLESIFGPSFLILGCCFTRASLRWVENICGPSLCWLQLQQNIRPARRRSCLSVFSLSHSCFGGKTKRDPAAGRRQHRLARHPWRTTRGPCCAGDEAGEQLGLGRSALLRRKAVAEDLGMGRRGRWCR